MVRNTPPPPRVQTRMRAFRTKTGGPWCWHCHHDLMALPRHGLCPECGNPYNADEPPPPTLRQRLNEFPHDFSVAVVHAAPWFAEKYLPTGRTWAKWIAIG